MGICKTPIVVGNFLLFIVVKVVRDDLYCWSPLRANPSVLKVGGWVGCQSLDGESPKVNPSLCTLWNPPRLITPSLPASLERGGGDKMMGLMGLGVKTAGVVIAWQSPVVELPPRMPSIRQSSNELPYIPRRDVMAHS